MKLVLESLEIDWAKLERAADEGFWITSVGVGLGSVDAVLVSVDAGEAIWVKHRCLIKDCNEKKTRRVQGKMTWVAR